MIPPQVQIMAKVSHQYIEDATYYYKGPALQNWNQNCMLINVIKVI